MSKKDIKTPLKSNNTFVELSQREYVGKPHIRRWLRIYCTRTLVSLAGKPLKSVQLPPFFSESFRIPKRKLDFTGMCGRRGS